jgi:hypothetical protein
LAVVADAETKKSRTKPVAGVLGALATIATVWWFALRPRRKAKKSG